MSRPDMKVELGPLKLKNPVLAMSGTFAYGREYGRYYDLCALGGIVVKTITARPRLGNPPPRIAETASGMLNAIGLQNPGLAAALAEELPNLQELRRQGTAVIGNVSGFSPQEYFSVTERLSGSGLVDAIELNISCPNVHGGGLAFGTDPAVVGSVVAGARAVCNLPLIVKLSPNVTDIATIAVRAAEAGADILSLINTLTGMAVDVRTRRPILSNVTGGLSGPAIKPVALRMVYEVAQAVKLPLIGTGGISSGTDAAEFMLAGAAAVGVGTANLMDPLAGLKVLDGLERFMEEEKIAAVSELIGGLVV